VAPIVMNGGRRRKKANATNTAHPIPSVGAGVPSPQFPREGLVPQRKRTGSANSTSARQPKSRISSHQPSGVNDTALSSLQPAIISVFSPFRSGTPGSALELADLAYASELTLRETYRTLTKPGGPTSLYTREELASGNFPEWKTHRGKTYEHYLL
jgi:hypothetical protein